MFNKIKKLAAGLLLASMASLSMVALAVPTAVTPIVPVALNPQPSATTADFTWTAADVANGNKVASTGRELILVNNTGASPYTVTFTSVAVNGRTGDITSYSVAAGVYSVFGPFPVNGWANSSDNTLRFSASNAAVKFAVIQLPSTP